MQTRNMERAEQNALILSLKSSYMGKGIILKSLSYIKQVDIGSGVDLQEGLKVESDERVIVQATLPLDKKFTPKIMNRGNLPLAASVHQILHNEEDWHYDYEKTYDGQLRP